MSTPASSYFHFVTLARGQRLLIFNCRQSYFTRTKIDGNNHFLGNPIETLRATFGMH